MAVLYRKPNQLKGILTWLFIFHAVTILNYAYPNTKPRHTKTLGRVHVGYTKMRNLQNQSQGCKTTEQTVQSRSENKWNTVFTTQNRFLHKESNSERFSRALASRRRSPRQADSNSPAQKVNLTCETKASCRGRCKLTGIDLQVSSSEWRCSCDNLCHQFQDCCADYPQVCVTNVTRTNTSYITDFQWQCNKGGATINSKGVWMISSCPQNWTEDGILQNCSKHVPAGHVRNMYKDYVPVVARNGNTYKNRFCALCHGIPTNETQFYNVQEKCRNWDKDDSLEIFNISAATNRNCSYRTWITPKGVPRRYCLEVRGNSSCSVESLALKNLCSSTITGIVTVSSGLKRLYRNSYCALCDAVPIDGIKCGWVEFHLRGQAPPNLAVVARTQPRNTQKEYSCEDGYVLDPFLEKCREITVLSPTFPFFNKYNVVIRLRSLDPLDPNGKYSEGLKRELPRKLRLMEFYPEDFEVTRVNDSEYIATAVLVILPNRFDKRINSLFHQLRLSVGNASFVAFNGTYRPILCLKIDSYQPKEYSPLTIDFPFTVLINATGERFDLAEYYSTLFYLKNRKYLVPAGTIYVCRKSVGFNCSGVLIALDEHEYILLPNRSLYRNQSKTIHRFNMINGSVVICVNYSSKYNYPENPPTAVVLEILTRVGLSLSIPCLLFVLVTYSLFRELRTLPGVNLINLSLSLLFTHSLFLLSGLTQFQLFCNLIAILLHYFYLVSFVWMSIIAFDTYWAFSRSGLPRQRSRNWNLGFIATGWFPALVFVAICFSLDQLQVVNIGYGDDRFCWIANARSNLFFFLIPVALSVGFNLILFLSTVHSINRTRQQTQAVATRSNRSSRTNFGLFLKLAILMGFTWIFAFLKFIWLDFFDYLFVMFTSLQGVYIALAFAFTSRVKKLYCEIFARKKTLSGSREMIDTPL